jgi:uncharacterized protein
MSPRERTPQAPLVAVRGEAVLEVPAEVARIDVSVAASEKDEATTLHLLNERAVAVDKILAGFPDAIERTESSAVRVGPRLPSRVTHASDTGYHGAVYHAITVTGLDRLGDLMAQLAEQDQIELGGPWWELRASSPVYHQVRVAAVRDAVRRARDYATALGTELAGLVELADARLLTDSRGQTDALTPPSSRLPHRVRAAAPEEFGFDLVPAKQVVRASVEARFTLIEPDLALVDAGVQGAVVPVRP